MHHSSQLYGWPGYELEARGRTDAREKARAMQRQGIGLYKSLSLIGLGLVLARLQAVAWSECQAARRWSTVQRRDATRGRGASVRRAVGRSRLISMSNKYKCTYFDLQCK